MGHQYINTKLVSLTSNNSSCPLLEEFEVTDFTGWKQTAQTDLLVNQQTNQPTNQPTNQSSLILFIPIYTG